MIGNEGLLSRPKTAFLASRKITPENVMASHAWATKVREQDRVIIGGFQSELERDVLKFLLRGTCPIIIVRANHLPSGAIGLSWRQPMIAYSRHWIQKEVWQNLRDCFRIR